MAEHPDPLQKNIAFHEIVSLEKKTKLEAFEKEDKQNKVQLLTLLNSFLSVEGAKKNKKKELADKFLELSKENFDIAKKWCDTFKEERESLTKYRNQFLHVLENQLVNEDSLKGSCVIPDNLRATKLIPFTVDVAPYKAWEKVDKDGKKEPAVFFEANPKAAEKWVRVGEGNSSVVFKSIKFASQISVKVIKGKIESGEIQKFENFVLEIRKISHPNVLKVYGAIIGKDTNIVDKLESNVAIYQEFVPKRTLFSVLFPVETSNAKVEHSICFSLHRKAELVKQMIEGLNALHHHNVVHGNLTSRNILLDEEFNVKIADHGLKHFTKPNHDELTPHSSILYTAPELFADPPAAPTKASDVYAFSIICWELFAEQKIYEGYDIKIDATVKPAITPEEIKKQKKDFADKWINEFKEHHKRPSIETIKVKALVHLITSAWETDHAKRTTFEALEKEKPWEKVSAEVAALSTELGKEFWEKVKKREGHPDQVEWEDFAKFFAIHFSVHVTFTNHPKYREALKSAVDISSETIIDETEKEKEKQKKHVRFVKKENWERFTKWFNLSNGPHLSASIYSLLNQPYFFGNTSKEEAHKKLQQHIELHKDLHKDLIPGTYLVRFENGHWILSYIDHTGIKDKTLEVPVSVELAVTNALNDKSLFPAKILTRPCPERPILYSNIDINVQQRKGAYTYSSGVDEKVKTPSMWEGKLLTSKYVAGQTFLA